MIDAGWMVIDGKFEDAYQRAQAPVFSPDSKRVAYAAVKIGTFGPSLDWSVIVDGEEVGRHTFAFDEEEGGISIHRITHDPIIYDLMFSPNSQRLAYVVQRGDKQLVVVDGVEGEKFDHIFRGIFFSPNSERTAYLASAKQGLGYVLVLDGKKEEIKADIIEPASLAFSPDGKRFAYVARKDQKWFLILDGASLKEYDEIITSPIFSPDSQRLAFVARQGSKYFAVIDGAESEKYDFMCSPPVFSPDCRRMAYRGEQDDREVVVIDGEANGEFDPVGKGVLSLSLIFSPDSKRVAYSAHRDGKVLVVVDGKQEGPYNSVYSLVFSHDSRQVGYTAVRNSIHFVVLNGEGRTNYDEVREGVIFSPGSRLYAYVGARANKAYVVVNGLEGKPWNKIVGPPVFDDSQGLHYVALRAKSLYLVEDSVAL